MRTILAIILLSILASTSSFADAKRAGTWQLSLTPQFTSSQKLNYENGDFIDLASRTGWGFGVGYNFSEYVSLDLNFNSSNGSYNAQVHDVNGTAQNFSSNLYSSSVDLALTYNIIDGPFTPYLTANVGSTFVDSGVATGNIYWGCGYYYYCGYYTETYTAVRVNLGAGLGVRYDFENMLYVKGGINSYIVDYDSTNTPYFINYQLTVGVKFR